jgi:hypothetical protein
MDADKNINRLGYEMGMLDLVIDDINWEVF